MLEDSFFWTLLLNSYVGFLFWIPFSVIWRKLSIILESATAPLFSHIFSPYWGSNPTLRESKQLQRFSQNFS